MKRIKKRRERRRRRMRVNLLRNKRKFRFDIFLFFVWRKFPKWVSEWRSPNEPIKSVREIVIGIWKKWKCLDFVFLFSCSLPLIRRWPSPSQSHSSSSHSSSHSQHRTHHHHRHHIYIPQIVNIQREWRKGIGFDFDSWNFQNEKSLNENV